MMKQRIIILLTTLLLCVCDALAVPAHPRAVTIRQPDGSLLTLRLVGDEWLHFNTTLDGYTVVKDTDGYYRYADVQDGQLKATSQIAHDAAARQPAERAFLAARQKHLAPAMTEQQVSMKQMTEQRQQKILTSRRAAQNNYENFRGLIILVQYKDREFSREDYPAIVNDMVNQENFPGYTDGEEEFVPYTGSVRDYFADNSNGKFMPQFDIAGPYTVDYSQYDGREKAGEIAIAAVNAADKDVNFKQYDGDGDGYVDLVFFIVAGNGANYSGNDERLWWPHRSVIYNNSIWVIFNRWVRKDGVTLYDYASSVELEGWTDTPSSVHIDGIGTICHEFSHVLGLPDLYDTNYETNGQSNVPGRWSVMSGGSYLNDSRTPAGYSLYERQAVGFIDDIPVIDAEGSYTLEPLPTSLTGYRIDTPVRNEYFLFENRQRESFKWDEFLPGSGMLVHRVEKTNTQVWENNTINCDSLHNYYEVVRAGGEQFSSTDYDVFPGEANVTELNNTTEPANLLTWSGRNTKWGLENIAMTDGIITFDIVNTIVLESISLPETATLQTGLTVQLETTLVPEDVECELTWTSDDETIATVDQQGVVTAVSEGTCTITVTAGNGMEASCELTVEGTDDVRLLRYGTTDEGSAYNLQGLPATPNRRGIIIRNGKKVMSE